jgi:broad-specificity NMP kinase
MRIIAIGGEPGSGKSTLMKRIINEFEMEPKYQEYKLVPYLQRGNIYILGKYEEGEVFSGTDRMSMAVQPEAIKFLNTLSDDSIVIYEGDRLFTTSFLEYCMEHYDLKIVYLETEREVRDKRCEERGSDQNEQWLQGRETKILNILSNMFLMLNVSRYQNNNLKEQEVVFEAITKEMVN